MGVDPRHDHSFRAPRPDLTVALGRENAPNACNDCHRDRSAQWAARAVRRWYPGGQQEKPHYALALHAGRTFQPGAEPLLLEVIRDPKQPGIVRGTAVSLLPPHLGPESLPALEKAARDPDPLVRLGAATTLEALPPKERVRIGVHLLWDPVRAVRVEAVPAFADVPDAELATEQRAAFDRSLDDFFLAQRSNAERPESHVNLGIVNVKRGRLEEARRRLRRRRSGSRRGSSPPTSTSPTSSGCRAGTTRAKASCGAPCRSTRRTPRCTTRSACCSCAGSARARPWPSSAARPSSPPGPRTSPTRTPSACTRRGGPTRPSPCCGRRRSAAPARAACSSRSSPSTASAGRCARRGPGRGSSWRRRPGDPSARALAASLEPAEAGAPR